MNKYLKQNLISNIRTLTFFNKQKITITVNSYRVVQYTLFLGKCIFVYSNGYVFLYGNKENIAYTISSDYLIATIQNNSGNNYHGQLIKTGSGTISD